MIPPERLRAVLVNEWQLVLVEDVVVVVILAQRTSVKCGLGAGLYFTRVRLSTFGYIQLAPLETFLALCNSSLRLEPIGSPHVRVVGRWRSCFGGVAAIELCTLIRI